MGMKTRIDETGNVYGKLTVIGFSHIHQSSNGTKSSAHWVCRCQCGREKIVDGRDLRRNLGKNTKSCGECGGPRYRHGHTSGKCCSPEYKSWQKMMDRCYSSKCHAFPYYGSRGIKVCDRWRSDFVNFLADMDLKPTPKHSIDRIDNDKDYEPGNCRWATMAEQNRNKRNNISVTINGRTMILVDWLVELGMLEVTYRKRILRGLSPQVALSTPVRSYQTRGSK